MLTAFVLALLLLHGVKKTSSYDINIPAIERNAILIEDLAAPPVSASRTDDASDVGIVAHDDKEKEDIPAQPVSASRIDDATDVSVAKDDGESEGTPSQPVVVSRVDGAADLSIAKDDVQKEGADLPSSHRNAASEPAQHEANLVKNPDAVAQVRSGDNTNDKTTHKQTATDSQDGSNADGKTDEEEDNDAFESDVRDATHPQDRAITNRPSLHELARTQAQMKAGCKAYIFYDKPPKTGSTAVTWALREYFQEINETQVMCGFMSCAVYARDVCEGRENMTHMIQHINANVSEVLCLQRRGFYSVTSVRDPRERWRSAYLYNVQRNKSHYNIPPTVSYAEFMRRIPNCALLRYYDQGSPRCSGGVDSVEFQTRVENVLKRFDEVIDLYEDEGGEVHSRVKGYVQKANESKGKHKELGEADEKELEYEMVLYRRLKELGRQLRTQRRGVLCDKPRVVAK